MCDDCELGLEVKMSKKASHGGSGRGQGRHKELGHIKMVAHRFLNEKEEAIAKQFTPRQRVEALLKESNKVAALTWKEAKKLAEKKGADARKVHQVSAWLAGDAEAGNDPQMLEEFNSGKWEVWQGYSVRMQNTDHAYRFFPGVYYEGA